jgi:cation diffusion facilitator CzcD-associated flavoprotein CzcO
VKNVCVIGAGPSGLAAAKNLLDAGLDVTVFDRQSGVGGNWRFSEEVGHSSVFETTHIISSKFYSAFADYPMPAHFPDYPSHGQLLEYFTGYAEHFKLLPHIQFDTLVQHCEPLPDDRSRPAEISTRWSSATGITGNLEFPRIRASSRGSFCTRTASSGLRRSRAGACW